jgi:hypothetical protein
VKGDLYGHHRETRKPTEQGNTPGSWDASRNLNTSQTQEEGKRSFWRDSVDDSASHGTSYVEKTWSPLRPVVPYRETTFRSSRDLTSRAQQYYQTGRFGHTGGESLHQDAPSSSSEAYGPGTGTFFDARSSIGGEEQASGAQGGDHSAALTDNVYGEGTGRSSVPSSEHARETDLSKLYEQLSYQGKELANVIYALDAQKINRSTVLPNRSPSDVNVSISLDTSLVKAAQDRLPQQYVRASYILNQGDIDLINQMYPNRQSRVISESESARRESVTSTYQRLANWSFGDQPVQSDNTEVRYEGDTHISSINDTLTSRDAKQLANILEYLHRRGEDASTLLMGSTLPDEQGNVTVTLLPETNTERAKFQGYFSEPFQNSYTISVSEQNQLENSILGRPSALAKMDVDDWQNW